MGIGSHVFAPTKNSPATRKSMPLGEFLLTVLIVTTASLVGAVGGIWLAERGRPAGRQEAVSPQASPQPGSRVESAAPRLPKADLPSAQISKAAAKRAEAEVIPLGLPSVRAIHHRSETDYTEISLELRAAAVLRAAQLHDPERVYFDLADSGKAQRPKGRLRSRRAVPMRDDDRVAGVRVVRWESGSVRVVVDLKHACEYSYRLTPGPRSLLTLRLWAHPAADTVADRKPPHQAATGIPEALGADRP